MVITSINKTYTVIIILYIFREVGNAKCRHCKNLQGKEPGRELTPAFQFLSSNNWYCVPNLQNDLFKNPGTKYLFIHDLKCGIARHDPNSVQ
jgi:hypothetical protein